MNKSINLAAYFSLKIHNTVEINNNYKEHIMYVKGVLHSLPVTGFKEVRSLICRVTGGVIIAEI